MFFLQAATTLATIQRIFFTPASTYISHFERIRRKNTLRQRCGLLPLRHPGALRHHLVEDMAQTRPRAR